MNFLANKDFYRVEKQRERRIIFTLAKHNIVKINHFAKILSVRWNCQTIYIEKTQVLENENRNLHEARLIKTADDID